MYIVQELCSGGELFDRLEEQPEFHYTEAQCAKLVKQMVSAVRYLHSKGIVHRDLKLGKILSASIVAVCKNSLHRTLVLLTRRLKIASVHSRKLSVCFASARLRAEDD